MADIEPIDIREEENTFFDIDKYRLEVQKLEQLALFLREHFERVKLSVLKDEDFVDIPVRIKQKDGTYRYEVRKYIIASGIDKLATLFKVSREVVKTEPIYRDGAIVGYRAYYKARLAGIEIVEYGVCYRTEAGKDKMEEFQIELTATTRAMVRAVRRILAIRDPTAEELLTVDKLNKPEDNFIASKNELVLKFYVNNANISVPISSKEYQQLVKDLKDIEGRPIVRNGTLYSVRYNADLAVKNNDAYEDAKRRLEKFIKEKNPIYEHEFIKIVSEEE